MKKINKIIGICVVLNSSIGFSGGVEDDPLLTKVMGEIEIHNGNNSKLWNVDAWLGKDLNKLWIKIEGEMINGKTTESELQLLYSKPISPFWDVQFGVRKDFRPDPSRTWGVVAAKGMAPYLFEVDTSLFIGSSGQIAVRLDVEYEYMLSQKLVLSPEVELNIHSKDDELVGTGKGMSDINAGVRLSYEVTREFAPYIGFNWAKKYGNTANFASNEGENIESSQLVAGIRFWF